MYDPGDVTFVHEVIRLEGNRAAHRWLCDGFAFHSYYANKHHYDEDPPPLIVTMCDEGQHRADQWNALSGEVQQAIRRAVRERARVLHMATG
jgi:hypothetical protein